MDISGKIVLITGGAGGLGKNFAEGFLEKGAKVFLADVDIKMLTDVENELSQKFGSDKVGSFKCDITNDKSFEDTFDECEKKFGSVDLLMNNAGVVNGNDFQKCIDINLIGTIRGSELYIKRVSKLNGGKGGHIVNTASLSGLMPFFVGPYYSAAKGGVIQYTRSIGHPFHYNYNGVTAQCFCPTLVDTPFLDKNYETYYNQKTIEIRAERSPAMEKLTPQDVTDAVFKLIAEKKNGATMVILPGKEPFYLDPPIPLDV